MKTQNLFQRTRDEWLDEARHAAQELLLKHHTITVEDVLAVKPRPVYLHKNVNGSIFNSQIFRNVGYTRAKHTGSHGHLIGMWTLKTEFFPVSMLAHRRRNVDEYGN